jgi:DNA polymerase III alpha subunit
MKKFRDGDTMSIFQFGTFLAHSIITKLKKVRNIGDLAIITSIARPGPLLMGMEKTFIKRVNGVEKIEYIHPSLESILEDTYGITCYQEQIMLTAQKLADFDGNESQNLMKAMSKKKADKVAVYKKIFLNNSIKKDPTLGEKFEFIHPVKNKDGSENKMIISRAEAIFLFCESFAEYGFNKSHAVAYSTVSYICMWLKHYYNIEWITAVLSGASKDDFKEFYAQWHNKIIKPDINNSKKEYEIVSTKEGDKCIMPFSFINGVGDKAVDAIVAQQPFASFEDFFYKIDHRKVNKTAMNNLIMSGAFDSLNEDDTKAVADFRKEIYQQFFDLKNKKKKPSKKELTEQEAKMEEVNSMTRGKFLMSEVQLLNLTSFNYYEFYKDKMINSAKKHFNTEALTPKQAKSAKNGEVIVVGGAVKEIRFFTIKKGKSRGKDMAILQLMNEDTVIKVTIFPNYLEGSNNTLRNLEPQTPIIIKGKVQISEQYGFALIYDKAMLLI